MSDDEDPGYLDGYWDGYDTAVVVSSKIDAENIFPHFLAIFALFRLQKDPIFGIFIIVMAPILLLDAF